MTIRSQQETAGNAILDAFRTKKPLVLEAPTGTGKSLAALIPAIELVHEAKSLKIERRVVVSTETTALQSQYVDKDLPFLESVYGGFKYRSLKGRTHYVCFNSAKQNSRGNTTVANMVAILEAHPAALADGERSDAERVLRRELNDREWKFLVGSTKACADNKCTPDECYSARARALALAADIVVVNHSLLRVDADSRDDLLDNFLGPFQYLVVDEAHTLESVLIDGWTETVTDWELADAAGSISDAVIRAQSVKVDHGIGYSTQNAIDGFSDYLSSVTRFFGYLHTDIHWSKMLDTISLHSVMKTSGTSTIKAMQEFENDGPVRLKTFVSTLEHVEKYLKDVLNQMRDQEQQGTRKISKGITACRNLQSITNQILAAMSTKDGVINDFGVPTIVTVSGIERRNGEHSVKISATPLDVSERAKDIWRDRSVVLLSATLRDLTDGSFRYLKTSLGIENSTDIVTESPFDYRKNQLVYVTPGIHEPVDISGARYNFDELYALLEASNGRALVLYTARSELDDGGARILQKHASGEFKHRILIQEKDSNKSRLISSWKDDTHSVFFATKSLFTGVDAVGETCSLVVLCKYPLPQYNVICKALIAWWRKRGFPNWYERESMTIFQQAAGRGIRTVNDKCVIALLDNRAANSGERVFNTAYQAIVALGSNVTRDINDVKEFLTKS